MRNMREEYLKGFLPESAFDFIDQVGAMTEERHCDIDTFEVGVHHDNHREDS